MRGDIDTRSGITKIIKVSLVVGLLGSSGLYATYVQSLFITVLPQWAATAVSGSSSSITTPVNFDNIWQSLESVVLQVQQAIPSLDFIDPITLGIAEIATLLLLVVSFAVYEFAIVMTGIMVAIGPVLLVGYLFEATKGIADRWVGKLLTYSILTLLINVTMNIILTGEKTYLRSVIVGAINGLGVPQQVKLILSFVMFVAMGAFIILGLPAVAAALGGGLSLSPAAAVARMITAAATGGASAAANSVAAAGQAGSRLTQSVRAGLSAKS